MSTSVGEIGYIPTNWENNVTPLNATNLNHMENGIHTNTNDIINLKNNKINKAKLLWENPNSNQAFAAQTIELESDYDYDMLEIFYYDWINTQRYLSQKLIKNQKNVITAMFRANQDNFYAGFREITYLNDIQWNISSGYKLVDAGSQASGQDNQWIIPVYIIGYKTGAFDEEETSI